MDAGRDRTPTERSGSEPETLVAAPRLSREDARRAAVVREEQEAERGGEEDRARDFDAERQHHERSERTSKGQDEGWFHDKRCVMPSRMPESGVFRYGPPGVGRSAQAPTRPKSRRSADTVEPRSAPCRAKVRLESCHDAHRVAPSCAPGHAKVRTTPHP